MTRCADPRHLYVSDLDGTLLQPDARLSDYARSELTDLIESGLCFTIASARNIKSIRKVLGDLPLQLPVIGHNGGTLTDFHTEHHLTYLAMAEGIGAALLRLGRDRGLPPFLSTWDGAADWVCYERCLNDGMGWYVAELERSADPRLRRLEHLEEALVDPVGSVNFIGSREELEPMEAEIQQAWPDSVWYVLYENMYCRGWWWLTVYDRESTKASAVQRLARALDIPIEQTTVFGDAVNDIPMFQAAGKAIATANAEESLLSCADETIGSNQDDSVVKYLRRAWEGRHHDAH